MYKLINLTYVGSHDQIDLFFDSYDSSNKNANLADISINKLKNGDKVFTLYKEEMCKYKVTWYDPRFFYFTDDVSEGYNYYFVKNKR